MCSCIETPAHLFFLPVKSPSHLLATLVVIDVLEGLRSLHVGKFLTILVSAELDNKLGKLVSALLFSFDLRINDLLGIFGEPGLSSLFSLFCHTFSLITRLL